MSSTEKECLESMKNLRSLVSNQSWLKHFEVINTLCMQTQHKTFFSSKIYLPDSISNFVLHF